jgi:integrin beta 2
VCYRQRQPDIEHPCRLKNGGCQHICVPGYKKGIPYAKCLCQPGYRLVGKDKCEMWTKDSFLLFGKGRPAMIKAISLDVESRGQDVMVPITNVSRPTALDFHVKAQMIYFYDAQR